jgi:hypothetical protein
MRIEIKEIVPARVHSHRDYFILMKLIAVLVVARESEYYR